MKDQYVGDIGDYGKYSLLREFSCSGIKVGINWYLTKDDGTNDGKFTDYLKSRDDYRRYDPDLFETLKRIAFKKSKSVKDIEESGIIPEAVFYSTLLVPTGKPAERKNQREEWFCESLNVLKDAELIFMDPDNGLLETGDGSKLGSEKYVLPEEVKRYFEAGHNVVYYCHKGRRTLDQWFEYKSMMFDQIPDAKPTILTFHRGSQRSYVFMIHEKDFVKYRSIIDEVKGNWFKVFTEEYTNKGDLAGNVSESITLTRSNGVTVTMSKREDGQLAINVGNDPNTTRVISADMFCREMGIW